MKKLALLFIVLVSAAGFAQSTFDKWPEIKEFHEIVSQTFHPSEEGNLEPIKSRSLELAQKAETLNLKEKPAEFKTKEILLATEKLQIKSWALHKKIKLGATDKEITDMLSEIHGIFHEIVGLCSKEK
jgi:hypothetical protein